MSDRGKRTWRLDFFGSVTVANTLDWLITLCLSLIVILTTIQMGGVRPETQLNVFPVYFVTLFLHGLWFVFCRDSQRTISYVPFLLLPFLLWAWVNVSWLSPAQWRGSRELVYFFGAWIFLWVLVNNVRTRGQLWIFVILILFPAIPSVLNGYYQFFQQPSSLLDITIAYPLSLAPEFLGRSTGIFADPDSFASFSLLLLSALLVAGASNRLPVILRIFLFYVCAVLVAAIAFAQVFWALAAVVFLVLLVPYFCLKRRKAKYKFRLWSGTFLTMLIGLIYFMSPVFRSGVSHSFSELFGAQRMAIWTESLTGLGGRFLIGVGGGAYSMALEQSDQIAVSVLPETPHNDYLLILNQYGIIGLALLLAPICFVFLRGIRRWKEFPFSKESIGRDRVIMPLPKFFLAVGVCSVIGAAWVAFFGFPFYVPALLIYGVIGFSMLAKHSIPSEVNVAKLPFAGPMYLALCSVIGFSFFTWSAPVISSHELELRAGQQFEVVVESGAPLAGERTAVDDVIALYREAIAMDSSNVDAWLGLSAALYQTHFRAPSQFVETSSAVLNAAESAASYSPEYWLVVANIGMAKALGGNLEAAEEAFLQSIKIAPNSSNANFYYASFLSYSEEDRELALEYVNRALEIDPANTPARELKQRLSIL